MINKYIVRPSPVAPTLEARLIIVRMKYICVCVCVCVRAFPISLIFDEDDVYTIEPTHRHTGQMTFWDEHEPHVATESCSCSCVPACAVFFMILL